MTAGTTSARPPTLLNQIVAVEQGVKQRAQRAITEAYHAIQRTAPLTGITRTYRPVDDDGEVLPGESTRVQISVDQVLADVATATARMLDVTLTKDTANQDASADIVVNGQTLLTDVPVTFLLTLEKRLVDLRTLLNALPTLDLAETWTYDQNAEAWKTNSTDTTRTKKIPRNHVKAPATDKHPAQVEIFTEDKVDGYWTTTKFSGAIPASRKTLMLERVQAIINAVVYAREQANTRAVVDRTGTLVIFDYLYQ